jgi:hypothetical protein
VAEETEKGADVLAWAEEWLARLDDPDRPNPKPDETRLLILELTAEVYRGRFLERKAQARGWPGWE